MQCYQPNPLKLKATFLTRKAHMTEKPQPSEPCSLVHKLEEAAVATAVAVMQHRAGVRGGPASAWAAADVVPSVEAQAALQVSLPPTCLEQPCAEAHTTQKPKFNEQCTLAPKLEEAAVAAAALSQRRAGAGGGPAGTYAAAGAVPRVEAQAAPQASLLPTRLVQPCAEAPAWTVPVAPAALGPPAPPKPPRPLPPGATTLVVRNIPACFGQERLLQEWPADGSFNFLFLPCNAMESRSKGHAAINFLTYELALAFQRKWHGNYLLETGHTQHLDVAASVVQGARDNLEAFLRKDVKMDECGNVPALFYGTRRVDTEEVLRLMCSEVQQASADMGNFSRISL